MEGEIGDKNLGVYGGADGSVLSGKASLDGGLTWDGEHGPQAGVHAELNAALAEGSVKGGFEILGVKFGGELKGEVGAGIEGGIGLNKDELEFDFARRARSRLGVQVHGRESDVVDVFLRITLRGEAIRKWRLAE